ncbi:MAG TPA: hypothetical protein VES20_04275 [Bryobacteraceae bacterium]|nr:hypothetical protein [Bryobacteraceae bacterium]
MKAAVRVLLLSVVVTAALSAQRNEVSLQFGGTLTQKRQINVPPNLQQFVNATALIEDNGLAAGLVYRLRLWRSPSFAIGAELPVFVVQATNNELIPASVRGFFSNTSGASGFFTPGAFVQFLPESRVVPFALFGAGYARVLEAQLTTQPLRAYFANEGTWAIGFGGGADLRLFRFLAIRGELRNFRHGGGSILDELPEVVRQRNTLLLTGGLVFRF